MRKSTHILILSCSLAIIRALSNRRKHLRANILPTFKVKVLKSHRVTIRYKNQFNLWILSFSILVRNLLNRNLTPLVNQIKFLKIFSRSKWWLRTLHSLSPNQSFKPRAKIKTCKATRTPSYKLRNLRKWLWLKLRLNWLNRSKKRTIKYSGKPKVKPTSPNLFISSSRFSKLKPTKKIFRPVSAKKAQPSHPGLMFRNTKLNSWKSWNRFTIPDSRWPLSPWMNTSRSSLIWWEMRSR